MDDRIAGYPLLLFGLVAVLLSGCASTAPTRFYVLTAVPETAPRRPQAGDGRPLAIGVGPVALPRYLDRPQVATHASPHELRFAEFDQWAEPLQDGVTSVLAENLSHVLGTDHVATHPWPRSAPVAYQVVVRMIHFEGTLDGQSQLTAQWQIVDAEDQKELMWKTSRFQSPVETADYRSMVAALSHSLGALSQDIAVALMALTQKQAVR